MWNEVLVNMALLITGLFLISLTFSRLDGPGAAAWVAVRYLLAVGTALSMMVNTIHLAPGLIFDLRTVPVALAARRHGLIAGLAVALPIGVYRWLLGGPTVPAGLLGLLLLAPRGRWLTLTADAHDDLHQTWWVPLRAFAVCSLTHLLGFHLAGRPVVDALPVYLAATGLSTLGMLAGHLAIATRLGALAHAEQLRHLTVADPLTGAFNRRQFDADLHHAQADTHLLLLDLDHFKRINDTYGHDTGDRVLRTFAALLRRDLRPEDRVYRLGGEEFAVLLHVEAHTATRVAERIRQTTAAELASTAGLSGAHVTVSGGLVPVRPQVDSAVRRADALLYAAKSAGRNRVLSATTARQHLH